MVKNLLEAEWLTAEFQVVLDQIFARFDADDDGLWSINEELQSFAMACNGGSPFSSDEIEQVRDYFDCDDSTGHLTKKGFVEMIHTQTAARPEDTWKDLAALGYDDTLALLPAGGAGAGTGAGAGDGDGDSAVLLVEDEAAKKRRKKKEKAARQKAAKAQAAGGGSNAGASITAKVQEGGLDQVMVKLYDDRCTVSERHASSGNLAEALRVALDALKIT